MELDLRETTIMHSGEVVESKFKGHPDTLADLLADHLSMVFSIESARRTGRILNHNFDKVSVLGGHARVEFSGGELLKPIRVLLNGRYTPLPDADRDGDVREILRVRAVAFIAQRLRHTAEVNISLIDELSTAPSPGGIGSSSARQRWFRDLGKLELDRRQALCNDTAVGSAFWPMTDLEANIASVRRRFESSSDTRLGTDVKMLAMHTQGELSVIAAVPAVSSEIVDLSSYQDFRTQYRVQLQEHFQTSEVRVNARDRQDVPELYMTITGSSIESGDEGVVGRGNRIGGMNPIKRPMSLEADKGKHPIYHTGKVYNILSQKIAKALANTHDQACAVVAVGHSGRGIEDPALIQISARREMARESVLGAVSEAFAQRRDAIHAFYADPSPDTWAPLSGTHLNESC